MKVRKLPVISVSRCIGTVVVACVVHVWLMVDWCIADSVTLIPTADTFVDEYNPETYYSGTFAYERLEQVPELNPIRWLSDNQDRFATGLVESQAGFPDHRAFTYDQALAAIAFTKSGNVERAKRIFDMMKVLQSPYGHWRSAYYASSGAVWEWNIDSGPIAWMVIAVNYYESETGDGSYADMAEGAILWLETRIDDDPSSGSYGALNLGENFWSVPNSEDVYATEHQFDAYSAFKNRAALIENDTLKNRVNSKSEDIMSYLIREVWRGGHFQRGFNDPETWLDCQSWAPMALGATGPSGEDFVSVLDYAHNNMRRTMDYNSVITQVDGFSYNDYQNTVWLEGTLQMADAYFLFGDDAKGSYYLNEMARTVRTDGGLSYSFDESGTAEDNWPLNLRYSAVSSTVWYYFTQARLNPFIFISKEPTIAFVTDAGNAMADISWIPPAMTPQDHAAFAWDFYTGDWVTDFSGSGMWYWFGSTDQSGQMNLGRSGAYAVWISSSYSGGGLYPCDNPWVGIISSGRPHQPIDVAAAALGNRQVSVGWKADVFGTANYWLIAYKIDAPNQGWISVQGPIGNSVWQYTTQGASEATLTMPYDGDYWVFLFAEGLNAQWSDATPVFASP